MGCAGGQEKLGASEQALAGMADDLDAKSQLVDLLKVPTHLPAHMPAHTCLSGTLA